MKFRRAQSLFFGFHNGDIYVQNFLQNKTIVVSFEELNLIKGMETWVDEAWLLSHFTEQPTADAVYERLSRLVLCGIIMAEHTREEEEDADYKNKWEWGPKTAAFHFALKNTQFFPVQSEQMKQFYQQIEQKYQEQQGPALYTLNRNHYDTVYEYTPPSIEEGLFKTIGRRRTIRRFKTDHPVLQEELVNCLYAGLGILKFRDSPPVGKMPIKTTPSGGARNPFEAYVLCSNVRNLPNGVYHYSALEHSLGLVNNEIPHTPASVLSDQLWINDAAVVVFLVANFDRTMWKYSHPVGYKAIMLEAGHIAQNILLAANEYGFYGSPTAAVIHPRFEDLIKEKKITQSCVYAIALGYAHEDAPELKA